MKFHKTLPTVRQGQILKLEYLLKVSRNIDEEEFKTSLVIVNE